MRAVLERASAGVFVPLTIGGGVRDFEIEAAGGAGARKVTALQVAAAYFRSGADKVSLGSDAVLAAEAYFAAGKQCAGQSSIEQISAVYGRQAVMISVDPRRVYVSDGESAANEAGVAYRIVELREGNRGPNGERRCWYQCTVKGGREGRPLDVFQLAAAVDALGAGELLVNSIDADGQKKGFDTDLLAALSSCCALPVIASSGAGAAAHFSSVFSQTNCEAALAAGIFHRREVGIDEVKLHLRDQGIPVRGAL
jgi:glutamine amidotransferase/cyclase